MEGDRAGKGKRFNLRKYLWGQGLKGKPGLPPRNEVEDWRDLGGSRNMRTSLCFTKMGLWNQKQNSVIPKSFQFLLDHTKKSKFTFWTQREPVACWGHQGDSSSAIFDFFFFFKKQFKIRRLETSSNQGLRRKEGPEAVSANGKSGTGCSDSEWHHLVLLPTLVKEASLCRGHRLVRRLSAVHNAEDKKELLNAHS